MKNLLRVSVLAWAMLPATLLAQNKVPDYAPLDRPITVDQVPGKDIFYSIGSPGIPGKANEGNTGFLPEERAMIDHYLAEGYVDAFRSLHPDVRDGYTWWSFRSGARERNIGWRIDYFMVNAALMPRVRAAAIHPEVTGSDHCPISLEIALA